MDKLKQPEQLIHEGATQRQYVRVDIPARARIQDKEYNVRNLSIGGISIVDREKSYRIGTVFEFFLITPFQSFAIDVPLKVEVEHHNKESGVLGCRFIELTKEKTSILTHLVRGYIGDDFVSAGEIMNITKPEKQKLNFPGWDLKIDPSRIGIFVLTAIVFCLGLYIILQNFENTPPELQKVQITQVAKTAKTYEIISEYEGVFQDDLQAGTQSVKAGEVIGKVVPPLLGKKSEKNMVFEIKSPCDCEITERFIKSGDFLAAGQTIMKLSSSE